MSSDPGTPTLDQLRVFLTVVDVGSFAGAARKLNRATSVISYSISNLETQLGVMLFDRESTRKPQLTEPGRGARSSVGACWQTQAWSGTRSCSACVDGPLPTHGNDRFRRRQSADLASRRPRIQTYAAEGRHRLGQHAGADGAGRSRFRTTSSSRFARHQGGRLQP